MIRIFHKFLFILLAITLCSYLFSQETKPETKKRGEQTKYLNIGAIILPGTLSKLEFQAKRHAIDVVLSTRKYNLRVGAFPKDLNENFANHYRMQITFKQVGDDTYRGDFLLANAINGGQDVTVDRVFKNKDFLLHFRLAIYELILGKDYVSQYLDELKDESEQKIDAIAAIAAQYLNNGNGNQSQGSDLDSNAKNKLNRGAGTQGGGGGAGDNLGNAADGANAEAKAAEALAEAQRKKEAEEKRKAEEAKLRADKAWQEAIKKAQAEIEERKRNKILDTSLEDKTGRESALSLKETKKTNVLKVFGNVFNQSIQSVGIQDVTISTNLSYLGAGAYLSIIEEDTKHPDIYKAFAKIGIPLKNDNYDIPMWRSLEAAWLKGNLLPKTDLGFGLEYTSQHFVNLNELGGGLTLIDGALLWLNAEVDSELNILNRKYLIELVGSYSLFFNPGASSVTLSGYKCDLSVETPIAKKISGQFVFGYMSMSGEVPSSTLVVDRMHLSFAGLYEF